MRLVDRHIINRTHQYWQVCDELAFKSKNLYNLANYYCRQHFFKCGKSLDLTKLYHATKDSDAVISITNESIKTNNKMLGGYLAWLFSGNQRMVKTSREVFGQAQNTQI